MQTAALTNEAVYKLRKTAALYEFVDYRDKDVLSALGQVKSNEPTITTIKAEKDSALRIRLLI